LNFKGIFSSFHTLIKMASFLPSRQYQYDIIVIAEESTSVTSRARFKLLKAQHLNLDRARAWIAPLTLRILCTTSRGIAAMGFAVLNPAICA
jgi:hypothetical protein